ncbi:extracellular solute-binding protein [Leucobacter sp. cx-42]|uniref:extracellular solute-binding protein n=1 Tax=unclassified Leucobacter TaxID=2621730 RepID=UPI00165E1A12|nr:MULTISPECIES: extracellular solute-binding protein [unclassified Leucobacter]MBC9953768.1 extracellular solute-binding protein [Leucobacter sp. cx-42]
MRKHVTGRRIAQTLAVTAVSALALTACGGGVSDSGSSDGAASTEYTEATSGEVNLYTWSDYYPEELVKKFTADTGIKLNVDYFDSNESLEAKLRASDGAGYDVVVPSDYMVEILKNDGLLLEFDATSLPNGGNIDPAFMDVYFDQDRKFSTPYLYGTTSFAYDTDVIKEDLDSWADYFNPPASAGKVGIMNDQSEVINSALRVTGGDFCTTDGPELQAAQDLLVGFKPRVGTINSDGIFERLANGEQSMAMIWNGAAHRAIQERPSIKFVYPTEGIALWQDNFAIPSGAKNVDQAKTFLNWMLDPENMAVAVNFQAYNSGVTGTEELMSEELRNSPAINLPEGYDLAKPVQPCNNEEMTNYTKIFETFKG